MNCPDVCVAWLFHVDKNNIKITIDRARHLPALYRACETVDH